MAKQENVYWPSSEETNIVPVEITDEVKQSMLQYSMSVLVGRALVDRQNTGVAGLGFIAFLQAFCLDMHDSTSF